MSRNCSCQAKPANYFVNFGVFLIQPSKKVFDHVMRAWHTGNHTYFPLFAEQSLMMDLVRVAARPWRARRSRPSSARGVARCTNTVSSTCTRSTTATTTRPTAIPRAGASCV